jgi:hypothetical protein
MTTPKKPAKLTGRPKPIAHDGPNIELTASELELLTAFRGMVDENQQTMIRVMKLNAVSTPRHAKPAFRLITGGAA